MTDYSRSATNLGAGLHKEFFGSDNAVVPVLRNLIAGQPEEVTDYLAEQWGMKRATFNSSLRTLASTSPSAITHTDQWRFPLRVAQCAALADRRVKANLVPSLSPEDASPRVTAMETIYEVGKRAVSFVHDVIDPALLAKSNDTATHWDQETKERVAKLGIRPHGFVKAMSHFRGLLDPEKLPTYVSQEPHGSMQALFRLCTVAAVLDRSLQIEFVPFAQQAVDEPHNV